jgi:tetratricopeptide (TPR) repeat protein
MVTLFDFSKEISQLTKNKNYSEALSFFKENKSEFTNEQIALNEYLISDMLSCLRHSNHLDAGFQFLSIYNIQINSETKERILTAYGWLLYSKYKAENTSTAKSAEGEAHFFDDEESIVETNNITYNKTELIVKIEELLPLLKEKNTDFTKTLISFLFSVVVKSEKKKPSPNWLLISDFCDNFIPGNLGTDCATIKIDRKGIEKDMELASDRENWYAYKTKALLKLGEWQSCFDLSKEALDNIEKFHYSNDVWFARRVALAKKNLGDSTETIKEFEAILRKKKEWFIQKELAELYFEENDNEKALKYAMEAISNFGPLEFKVDLLFLMGKILKEKNENEMAFKHFSLSKLVRQVEEWSIPKKLDDELHKFEYTAIDIADIDKIKSELKKYWESQQPRKMSSGTETKLKGEITRILNDNERGKDGFLISNAKEYYFSLSINFHLTAEIKAGTKVEFKVMPASPGKKEHTRIFKIID